jgi:DNA-binding MarR family transcriptional regulator
MSQAASSGSSDDRSGALDPTEFLFHLFIVLSRHRDAQLDRGLRPLGLNVSRHRAISVIASFEPCTMGELSEFSCVDRTTMTRTVDQLVSDGWVERTASPSDRRQVLLVLTEQGRGVYREARGVIVRINKETAEGVTEEQRRAMIRAQRAMIGNLINDAEATDRIVNLRRPGAKA